MVAGDKGVAMINRTRITSMYSVDQENVTDIERGWWDLQGESVSTVTAWGKRFLLFTFLITKRFRFNRVRPLCGSSHGENPTSHFLLCSVNVCLEGPSHIFRYYTWISSLTGCCIRYGVSLACCKQLSDKYFRFWNRQSPLWTKGCEIGLGLIADTSCDTCKAVYFCWG